MCSLHTPLLTCCTLCLIQYLPSFLLCLKKETEELGKGLESISGHGSPHTLLEGHLCLGQPARLHSLVETSLNTLLRRAALLTSRWNSQILCEGVDVFIYKQRFSERSSAVSESAHCMGGYHLLHTNCNSCSTDPSALTTSSVAAITSTSKPASHWSVWG